MSGSFEDLWRNFPKTAIEFEERFATGEDCRAYWIKARWGGEPACARCHSKRVWRQRGGTLFECAECGHQTSLTSGTVLARTRKPLKTWFRAVFEISARRNGISAKELQRIMGFGSYKTAWSWLHKLRASMVRRDRGALRQNVAIDEAFVGSKHLGKAMVLVAKEAGGRVRLAHVENNDEVTLKRFVDTNIVGDAAVTTDGLASYNPRSLDDRQHVQCIQTAAERRPARCALVRLNAETLATRYIRRRRQDETPTVLPRRVRLPIKPAKDQRRRPHSRARHRTTRRKTRHHHA